MRQIELWFHQVLPTFISGGTLQGCEWGSYGRPHPTSGVWTASQPWTPSFGITTTPSHGQRRRSSAGLSHLLIELFFSLTVFFPHLFRLVLVDYTVNGFTEVTFGCLLVITLNLNGIQTFFEPIWQFLLFLLSSIIILYRCPCFRFSWSIFQCCNCFCTCSSWNLWILSAACFKS